MASASPGGGGGTPGDGRELEPREDRGSLDGAGGGAGGAEKSSQGETGMDQVSDRPESPELVVSNVSETGGQQQPVTEQGTEEQYSMSLSSAAELGLSHREEQGTADLESGPSDLSSDAAGPTGELSLAKRAKQDITEHYVAEFRQGLDPQATLRRNSRKHKLC